MYRIQTKSVRHHLTCVHLGMKPRTLPDNLPVSEPFKTRGPGVSQGHGLSPFDGLHRREEDGDKQQVQHEIYFLRTNLAVPTRSIALGGTPLFVEWRRKTGYVLMEASVS